MYFDQIGVIFDCQVTNRGAAGEGGTQQESSLLPIGRLEVIYDSQLCRVFIAIWITVKIVHVFLYRDCDANTFFPFIAVISWI